MATLLVGLREFRANLTAYTKRIQKGNTKIIVLNKNKPVLEIRPIDEDEFILEKYADDIAEAREQVKRGETYSHEEVRKMLGI